MTTDTNPWVTRETIDAAVRAAEEQQHTLADPQMAFKSQLRDRIDDMLHAASTAGFDLASLADWGAVVDASLAVPEPSLSAFRDDRTASLLQSQLQGLVQAMASFSPPAAGQTSLSVENRSNLAQAIAANWR